MSVGAGLGLVLVVAGVVMLARSSALAGRAQPGASWTVRVAGPTEATQALWSAGSIASSLGAVVLWQEVGVLALAAVFVAVVVAPTLGLRLVERRGRKASR